MAEELKLVSDFAAAKAGVDLRTFQHRCVAFTGTTGLTLHTGATSAAMFILQNKPNSGDPCEIAAVPSHTKAIAGAAVTVGAWVTCATSGGFLTAAASGCLSAEACGVAMATANSGDTFTVALRR